MTGADLRTNGPASAEPQPDIDGAMDRLQDTILQTMNEYRALRKVAERIARQYPNEPIGAQARAALATIAELTIVTEPAPPTEPKLAVVARPSGSPDTMTRDDWDELYFSCESNAEGEVRGMVRYAYEAGWKAAMEAKA